MAKLVDFGLAKSVGGLGHGAGAPTTIEGRLAGTVAYMSPEQAEGTEIDFRSDIFSFGSLLYEMLTRQRAFAGGSTVSILAKIIHTQPDAPAGMSAAIDPRLQEIVSRCLRKDRSRRFQSMGEVRVRLQEIIDEPVVQEARRAPAPVPAASGWRYAVALTGLLAVIAVALALVFRPRPTDAPQPLLHRLTWDGGLTTQPAVSRDETMVAYASDRLGRGDLDIWLGRLNGGDPIRLSDDPADDSAPDISPDGTHVAYRSERSGAAGVYIVSSLGGTPRLVASDCHDPKYSPDNQWLACWTGEIGGAFYPKTARILILPATGGPSRQFRADFDTAAFPLWMPDSSGLLFLGRKAGPDGQPLIDWWVAADKPNGEAHATGARPVFDKRGLSPVADAYFVRPASWLNGGGAVLFAAQREDATNVYNMGISARGEITSQPAPTTFGPGSDERPTAPAMNDGSVVFSRVDVDYQLRRVPLPATGAPPEPLLPNLSQVGSPTASLDGGLLLYSERQLNGYRVVSVDMQTGAEGHSVTNVESPDFVRVLVSGDGKVVVYGGPKHINYRMRINQGPPEAICTNCGLPTHVNFDGSAALFESRTEKEAERLQIWSNGKVMPLVGSADPKGRRQYAGRFSPDGRWVVFCAGVPDGNAREIVVVPNAPGRALRDDEWVSVSEGPLVDREPVWSSDGRRVFYISDRDGFRCIWARDIDPKTGHPIGHPVPIAHFHLGRELLRGPMPAPGSIGLTATRDSLIFTVARSRGNLWWQTPR